jgi:hypothetical protein
MKICNSPPERRRPGRTLGVQPGLRAVAAVLFCGVVIRLKDLDEAFQGGV